MTTKQSQLSQRGTVSFEALVGATGILVFCLLVLQLMLLYRTKITLNYATQEAARIGAMNNGRVVPRFMTDITQFTVTVRTKKKCLDNTTGASVAPSGFRNKCPTGSTEEGFDPVVPTGSLPGASATADGEEPTGGEFDQAPTGGASAPAPRAGASDLAAANRSKKSGAAQRFLVKMGRGMMRYGDSSVLQGFIIGMAPLYTRGADFSHAAAGQVNAYSDALMNTCIVYHNPTQAAFLDFGFMELDGPDKLVLQIPSDLLRYRIPGNLDSPGRGIGYHKKQGKYLSDEEPGLLGTFSAMSVQDATLLSIEIKYSAKLEVPVAREILIGLGKLTGAIGNNTSALGATFVNTALDKYRWPMSSFATYRMQTPVHWQTFYPFGDITKYATPEFEVFDVVKILWDVVSKKVNNTFDPAEPQIGFCPGMILDSIEKKLKKEAGGSADTPSESASSTSVDQNGVSTWIGQNYDEYIRNTPSTTASTSQ